MIDFRLAKILFYFKKGYSNINYENGDVTL